MTDKHTDFHFRNRLTLQLHTRCRRRSLTALSLILAILLTAGPAAAETRAASGTAPSEARAASLTAGPAAVETRAASVTAPSESRAASLTAGTEPVEIRASGPERAVSSASAGSAGSLTRADTGLVPGAAAANATVTASTNKGGSGGDGRNQTTMYISSALTQRRGLCVLLENVSSTGTKHFGLIDTGNANTYQMKTFLKKHGVTKLEFLVLTHMHKDHYGNAAWLIRNYRVEKLYVKQFDAKWSNGSQAAWESIIKAALTSPYTRQIIGSMYCLSMSGTASPSASAGFLSFLKTHEKDKYRFKGLFNSSNTSLNLGAASLRLYNWEIWDETGVREWIPGKTRRCKVSKYGVDNSDNCLSLGVRLTYGGKKFWIGGDMNNLRLSKKHGSLCRGDEERLASQIGHVDAMVLDHHGRAGSNCTTLLDTLSPRYVIYTSTKVEITSGLAPGAADTLQYIRNNLHLPDEQILWACSYWGTHTEDPSVTISTKTIVSAVKDGTDMEHHRPSAKTSQVTPLLPGYTYTSYDVTGDGKADRIRIISPQTGSAHKGLTIRINNQDAWSTAVSFTDARPVTLVRPAGKNPFVLISIVSPVGSGKSGRVLGIFRYGKYTTAAASSSSGASSSTPRKNSGTASAGSKGSTSGGSSKTGSGSGASSGTGSGSGSSTQTGSGTGSSGKSGGLTTKSVGSGSTSGGTGITQTGPRKYGLICAYDVLQNMPVSGFTYSGAPAVSCAAGNIRLTCTGSDALSAKAFVTFVLTPNSASTALRPQSAAFPYACTTSASHAATLPSEARKYNRFDAKEPFGTLPKGTKLSVTHVLSTRTGEVRYRVTDQNKKVFWISLSKASK